MANASGRVGHSGEAEAALIPTSSDQPRQDRHRPFFRLADTHGCRRRAGQVPACPGIHVTILGIRNSVGTVDCALFDSPNGFPVDVLRSAVRLVAMKVPRGEARAIHPAVPWTFGRHLVANRADSVRSRTDLERIGMVTSRYADEPVTELVREP
jgi:hypothetical protein